MGDVTKNARFWMLVCLLRILVEANVLVEKDPGVYGPRLPPERFVLHGLDKCEAEAEFERWWKVSSAYSAASSARQPSDPLTVREFSADLFLATFRRMPTANAEG